MLTLRRSRGVQLNRCLRVMAGLLMASGLAGADTFISADDDRLRQALEAADWRVETQSDGSMVIRAPAEGADTAVVKPSTTGEAANQSMQVWERRLRALGWGVERDADGSLLLYPPGEPATESAAQATTAKPTGGDGAPGVSEKLDRLLEKRGWKAHRQSDGSLILIPKGRTAAVPGQPAKISPCPGQPLASFAAGAAVAPVNDWNSAKQVSDRWLQASGEQGLTVGRIRKVLRVYIVSIVESRPPHRLRHQIAIDARDGDVMVLN